MNKLSIVVVALASTASADSTLGESKGVMIIKNEVKDAAFQTPESVVYDATTDTFLVANINGSPTDTDNNGFISKVGGDGKLKELKWIEGGKKDVKLDAPKGMAISGGVLWVADISVVRKFDPKTGKALGDVKIDGATFLNDVATGKNGGVYVTDSGLTPKFEASGSDAVYSIAKDGKVTTLAKGKQLGHPNGITEANGKIYVVTFGSGAFYEVPAKGDPKPEKLPKGKLDGIVALPDGNFYISSWEAKGIFHGKPGKWHHMSSIEIDAPADMGWDSKRKQLLIPSFTGNKVSIVNIKW